MVRAALCEVADVMLTRVGEFSTMERWAPRVARRRGVRRARPALARAGDRPAPSTDRRRRVPLRRAGGRDLIPRQEERASERARAVPLPRDPIAGMREPAR